MSYPILDGDLFESGADSLVCPSNCFGPLGKGIAEQFKMRFPQPCASYTEVCDKGRGPLRPGDTLERWKDPRAHDMKPLIYFAMTKDHWSNPSRIDWIRVCAAHLLNRGLANAGSIHSMAVPAIGCGEGRLFWDDVRPILVAMAEELARAGVKVMLYGPDAGPKRSAPTRRSHR